MEKVIPYLTAMILLSSSSCGVREEPFDYMGQERPGDEPQVFAPDIISIQNRKERSLTISQAGDEIFFCKAGFPYSILLHMVKLDYGWSHPDTAVFSRQSWATEPAFSPDGHYLYYSSSSGKANDNDYHLWRVNKTENGWADPERLFDIGGSTVWQFHPSVTDDGTLYFCYWENGTGDICLSRYVAGVYAEWIFLDKPINTEYRDVDPYIAPDESYLIF